jgi:hypothetical protein
MARLAAIVRWFHDREPAPSMVMVDAQTVKGARYGPTFHQAGGWGGRTIGTKRTLGAAPSSDRSRHPFSPASGRSPIRQASGLASHPVSSTPSGVVITGGAGRWSELSYRP